MYVCMYATSFVRLDNEWKLLKLKLHWVTITNTQYKVYYFALPILQVLKFWKKNLIENRWNLIFKNHSINK
jgi:hypothetical protein